MLAGQAVTRENVLVLELSRGMSRVQDRTGGCAMESGSHSGASMWRVISFRL